MGMWNEMDDLMPSNDISDEGVSLELPGRDGAKSPFLHQSLCIFFLSGYIMTVF